MTTFGSYELLRRLGMGGTAEVFLAAASVSGGEELVALKLVLPHLAEDDRLRQTLLHEARTAALVRHRNVVEIYEVGEAEGRPFLAMEFVRGWPLNTFLKRLQELDQALTIPEVCSIIHDAALGLHCAHEATDERGEPLGLIHRDISPHNLMLRDDGRVKVVDFGLAKATLEASSTQTGGMKGKIAYMPPEQIENKPLDRRADVFAAGAVLWELLAGEKLHPGRTEVDILQQAMFQPQRRLDRVAPGLPRELVELVEEALERDVRRRLPSADALAAGLEPWISDLTGEKIAHRLQTLFEPLPRTVAEARAPVARRASGEKRVPQSTSQRPGRPTPGEQRPARGSGERPAPRAASTERAERPTGEQRPERSAGERPVARERPPVAPRPRTSDRTEIRPSPFTFEGSAGDPAQTPNKSEAPGLAVKTSLELRPYGARAAARPTRQRLVLVAGGALIIIGLLVAAMVALPRQRSADALPGSIPEAVAQAPNAPSPDSSPSPEAPAVAPHPVHAGKTGGKNSEAPRASEASGGPARLVLRSNVIASVREGDRDLGMTPMTIELSAGAHHLELKSIDGQGSASLNVTLQPGEQTRRTVKLPPG